MVGFLDSQVIEKFKEFQKSTGKYSDIGLDEISFIRRYPFNDEDNVTLIGSKYIASHEDLDQINDQNGLPVYDASANINTYVNENKFPNEVFEVEDNKNPDISFASEGNSSAGTNFIIHKDKYFVNNHRTVIKFTDKYYSKYIYYNIFRMKEKYGFKRGYTPSQKELKRLKIMVPIPNDYRNYSSFEIQRVIVEFLEFSFDHIEKIKKNIDKHFDIVDRMKKSLIPSTFKKTAIQNRFEKYAKENNIEFNIRDIEFENKVLNIVANFPSLTRITGGYDISIEAYENLHEDEKSNYFALISGTIENNQISGYVYKDRLEKGSLSSSRVISWTRINGKVFFLQDKPVCTNDDSFVMETFQKYSREYIRYSILQRMRTKQFDWGNKAGQNKIKNIEILVPKPLGGISSFELQKNIANFIISVENELQENHLNKINRAYEVLKKLQKTYVARTFLLIDWRNI